MIDIEEGESLAPYLDGDLTDETIRIPSGTYRRGGPWRMTLANTTIEAVDGPVIIEGEENAYRAGWNCEEDSVVRGLVFKGTRPEGGTGDHMQGCHAINGSELRFEYCRWPDGSVDPSDTHGMYVRGIHDGKVLFRRCEISGFGDNGLYGSAMGSDGGVVGVEESVFLNNNIAGVRIGGDGSYVTDSFIAVDDAETPSGLQGFRPRGVWVRRNGDYLIENTDFVFNSEGNPIWTLNSDIAGGTTTVKNCRIRQDGSGAAIRHRDSDHTVTGSGNHLVGTDLTDAGHVFECVGDGCETPGSPPDTEFPVYGTPDPIKGGLSKKQILAGAAVVGALYKLQQRRNA